MFKELSNHVREIKETKEVGEVKRVSKIRRKGIGSRLIDIIPGITRNPNSPHWKSRYKYYLEIEPEVREEVEAEERAEQEEWEAKQRMGRKLGNLKAEVRALRDGSN